MTREEYVRMWDPDSTRHEIPGYLEMVEELYDTLDGAGPNPYQTLDPGELYHRRGEFPEFDERIMRAGDIAIALTEMVRKAEMMQ